MRRRSQRGRGEVEVARSGRGPEPRNKHHRRDSTAGKKRRIGEPEDTIDEQPDDNNWLDASFAPDVGTQNSLPRNIFDEELTRFTNEVTTINDVDVDSTPAPSLEDLDPASPEYRKLITLRYNQQRAVVARSSPPMVTTEAETLQYNVHKAWPVMATFRRDKKVLQADIVAVQEPWKNENQQTTHQPATATFKLLYPMIVNPTEPRPVQDHEDTSTPPQPGVCLFVSKKVDPATWSYQLMSGDYQLLGIRQAHLGKDWTNLFIHNVYNRPGGDTWRS
ncbi:hypothetical protein PENSUB_4193 [Penicillium subrubescens]|jgi:hypothetical protein|uniref:Uncharacterized protein n=1 Tax=Penicillium subrubescens TaxID=1316194 RepID=A0A1Q5UCX8_9EURO|nr:hypothetical protein PENSUB_4193 [Penicillium subrubescens]